MSEDKKPDLIRTNSSMREGPVIPGKEGYYRILHARDWGKVLFPSGNPEGAELSKFELEGIQLNPGFNKIPHELWSPYLELCFFMCPDAEKLSPRFHDGQLEVQVCLLRDLKTMTKWKIVVPRQVVSGVSVKAELAENIDLVTGEKYHQFPPVGWVHAGSAHSHNTMNAFFSSTDDRSDSTVPGLHLVIGSIDHKTGDYSHEASVVIRRTRKTVELEDVVDIVSTAETTRIDFHPDVIDYIDTVVSANRKFFLKSEEKEKEEKASLFDGISLTSKDGKSDSSVPDFLDENGNLTAFFNSLDLTNSDLFDSDSFFPFDDDIESILNHSLDSGHTLNDIVQSVFRANFKRSKELSSDEDALEDELEDVTSVEEDS